MAEKKIEIVIIVYWRLIIPLIDKIMTHIETDPKKVCLALIEETRIERLYDPVKDITTFEFVFPEWLKQNYSGETVKYLIDTVTPIIVEEMNTTTQKECFQVTMENC